MLSSRASSVGGNERRDGGLEVILTPSVFRLQIVSLIIRISFIVRPLINLNQLLVLQWEKNICQLIYIYERTDYSFMIVSAIAFDQKLQLLFQKIRNLFIILK